MGHHTLPLQPLTSLTSSGLSGARGRVAGAAHSGGSSICEGTAGRRMEAGNLGCDGLDRHIPEPESAPRSANHVSAITAAAGLRGGQGRRRWTTTRPLSKPSSRSPAAGWRDRGEE